MFLSRVVLNPQRRKTLWLLSSTQRLHATVLNLFPPDAPQGRVLWRLDEKPRQLDLLVVSAFPPDFAGLVEEAGWSTAPGQTTSYVPFLDRLDSGQRWRFRLTANPTRAIRLPAESGGVDRSGRGKVIPLTTETQQLDWLTSRALNHGFTIDEDGAGDVPKVVVARRSSDQFRRCSEQTGSRVRIMKVTYDGILTVTDPEHLRSTLTQGIGRAKGYGCGLLTLAPAT